MVVRTAFQTLERKNRFQRHMLVNRNWDHHELWKRLFPLGVQMVRDAVRMIEQGRIILEPQDPQFATWEPLFDAHSRLYRPKLLHLSM